MAGQMAVTVLRQSPCSNNWKPYKTETKDIGIQAYDVILQPSVGYRATAYEFGLWTFQTSEVLQTKDSSP